MNHKSKTETTSEVSRRKFLGVAALAPVGLAATRVSAQTPCPMQPHMGTAGVAAGQVLRVSVFNHAEVAQQFKIEIFGLDGLLLGEFQGGCSSEAGAFADFDVAAALKKGERVQVHIHVTAFSDHPLGATAEVFDTKTGATAFPRDPCAMPVADPAMTLGSVGMIPGESVRVSVFHEPAQFGSLRPTVIELRGLDGQVLASHQERVLPGRGIVFDWGTGFAGFPSLQKGERLQVHLDVHAEDIDQIGATIEVYDPNTGLTRFPRNPCVMPL